MNTSTIVIVLKDKERLKRCKVQVRMVGMSLVLQVFDNKAKYWTNLNLNLK